MKGAFTLLAIGIVFLVFSYSKLNIFWGNSAIDIHLHDTYFVMSRSFVMLFILFFLGTLFAIGGFVGSRFKNKIFLFLTIFFLSFDTVYAIAAYKSFGKFTANKLNLQFPR